MQYRPLGSSDIEASVVGLGCWAIGGWMWGGVEEQEAIRTLQAGIDEGISLFDTAPVYGFGVSETLIGKAIADRRDWVVLATMCGLQWREPKGEHHFDADDRIIGASEPTYRVYKYLAPTSIRIEIEESLRRLQTDYIDLYQTHWQETTTPIEDTMAMLMTLRDEGKIRAIGCSNATQQQMDEYRAAGVLSVDQERYSMLDREHETTNLPYCAENDIAFLAYSPLAMGLLTGKLGPERTFAHGDMRNVLPRFSVRNREQVAVLLEELRPVAEAHAISLAQLAIAWVAAQPGCSHVLCGARHVEQVRENAAAAAVRLTEAELTTIAASLDRHGMEID